MPKIVSVDISINLKKIIYIYLFLFFNNLVFSQSSHRISGYVFDAITNEPLVGANIMVKNEIVGSVSTKSGSFTIEWDGSYPVTIMSSFIGYAEQEIEIGDPMDIIVFRLESTVIDAESVNITRKRRISDNQISSGVEIISTQDSEKRGIRDVSEILQEMKSVAITSTNWGKQNVNIRGSNANEVAVYLDGVKLNSSLDGVANLAFIDMTALEDIEVIKGGNSILFGPGNFGGVILLNSKITKKNSIKVNHTFGITDDSDQDLGGMLTLNIGVTTFGVNYSEKSRMYDGRTMQTSLYSNNALNIDFSSFNVIARRLNVENSITYPSGISLSADNMLVDRFDIKIRSPLIGNWYIHGGNKNWRWKDNFFSNIKRDIKDASTSIKIGKEIVFNRLSGKFHYEVESDIYQFIQNISDSYSKETWEDRGELVRDDYGYAGVLKFTVNPEVEEIDMMRLEAGIRNSKSYYKHNQDIAFFDNSLMIEDTNYNFKNRKSLYAFKLGSYLKGKIIDSNYELFFNQGFNYRPPTLNDQLLWKTSRTLNDQINFDKESLDQEYVTTTELNLNIFRKYNNNPLNSFEIGAAVFRNSYLEKIFYVQLEENLIAPFNRSQAWINGAEASLKWSAFNNLLKGISSFTLLSLSEEKIFPNKPRSQGSTNIMIDWKSFLVSISYLYQGEQNYLINGISLKKYKKMTNTNISISYKHTFWKLDVTAAYIIRNVFSDKITIINSPDFQNIDFNYYDSHRKLFTITIMPK